MNKVSNSKGKRICAKAFMLVELLVVVSIIALLVSTLLPTLSVAKEQARIVVCATNMRNIGSAYHLYTNQHNGWLPASSGWGGDPPTWDTRILSFYENVALLHCPSDNFDREPWYVIRGTPEDCRYPRSYAHSISIGFRGPSVYGDNYNPPYAGQVPYTPNGSVYKITDIELTGETIAVGEQWESWFYGSSPQPGIHGDYKGSGIYDGYYSSSVPQEPPSRSPTPYHRDNTSYNFLFCDGHVIMLEKTDKRLIDIDGDGYNDSEDLYFYKRMKP